MNKKNNNTIFFKDLVCSKFHNFAQLAAVGVGSPVAFVMSFLGIIVWAVSGPFFNYSDTWQLIINTSTTVITFLMVFLIQHTQNRDAQEIHLKLDELIRANKHARNHMIDLHKLSDSELENLHKELCEVQEITEEKIHNVKNKIQKQQDLKRQT